MTTLSAHILDTTLGLPASNVQVSLYQLQNEMPQLLSQGITDESGRIKQFELSSDNRALAIGEYQLVFATAEYFAKNKRACFYPKVTIDFVLDGTQAHCHVPLLISSYGFSTYRGS